MKGNIFKIVFLLLSIIFIALCKKYNFQSEGLEISYLIGSVTFIIGLKMMGNAKTARSGNKIGAIGMTIAIAGTIVLHTNADGQPLEVNWMIYEMIGGAILLGTIIG